MWNLATTASYDGWVDRTWGRLPAGTPGNPETATERRGGPTLEPIVEKVEARAHESPISLQDRQDREVRVHVEARKLEGMKKEALVTLEHPAGSVFRMRCDEGAHLGGDDTAPPPLSYFSAAMAF
jgi:hypothetical protein